jgi:hypothetical protein
VNLNFPNLTPRQRHMIETDARVLWVGAGTKTGKTVAAWVWAASVILGGGSFCWVGPWSDQTFISYSGVKSILRPFIDQGLIHTNDSKMKMFIGDREVFTPKTGDNADAIFGGGYDGVMIDEASRQTLASLTAARTTVSATEGKIKLMFNLDHGAANWAVRNLLRVKSMTDEERAETGEEFMIFPTGGEGLVSEAEIEMIRKSGMPEPMFNALYHAQIPDTDLTLFHNLPHIFKGGPQPEGPELGHHYLAGMDVARKKNWTVVTVMDASRRKLVAMERFHEVSWTLQYAKAKALYDRWNVGRLYVDATGLGDPVEEELTKLGMNVEPFLFTEKNRTQLIEQMVIACDAKDFTVTLSPEFDVLRAEMENFGVLLDEKTGKVKYGVDSGHDDAAFSLMLCWHNYLQGGHGPTRFASTATEQEVRDKSWGAM